MEADIRLLQVARLSRLNEDSSSLDKQDQQCQRWAEAYGHEIIATAADSNISGKTDPFQRPELGPWLTEPRLIETYNGIVAAKLDRFARSVRYWAHLLDWARDRGKVVVCVEPYIDFSTPTGQLVGMVMSWLAEQELAQITQRSNDTKLYLQENGYVTGKAPFGYRIVAHGDHKTLAPDPVQAQLLREAVRMYLDGSSLYQVRDWLDERCTAPQGNAWSAASLSSLFHNPVLVGRRTDARGKTILKVEPILDRATWDALQAKQSARAKTTGTMPKSLLTGIAVCGLCDGPMYRLASTAKGKKYTYYRCHGTERNPSRCRNMVRLETLDAQVEEFINGPYGAHPRYEMITFPGHGHDDDIAEVEQDLRELDYDTPDFLERQAELLAERKRLQALPMMPARTEPVLTGDTIRDYWATLDTDGKRAYLNRVKMQVKVRNGEKPMITIWGGLTGLRPGIVPVALPGASG
jgi:DNA invertase Pin-like site-specific DNA recombinase